MSIGNRIKERRKELNMSVDKLAELLGKNRATVYRYESDEIENLPLSILEPLAKALITTPANLMGWGYESKTESLYVAEESSYYTVEKNKKTDTLLDYFSNNKFSEIEADDIIKYAEFIKSKRQEKL